MTQYTFSYYYEGNPVDSNVFIHKERIKFLATLEVTLFRRLLSKIAKRQTLFENDACKIQLCSNPD